MRFAVTFGQGNAEGVMVFTAEDMEAAKTFVSDLLNLYGHSKVSDPLPYSGNVSDLYKTFPPKKKATEQDQTTNDHEGRPSHSHTMRAK